MVISNNGIKLLDWGQVNLDQFGFSDPDSFSTKVEIVATVIVVIWSLSAIVFTKNGSAMICKSDLI